MKPDAAFVADWQRSHTAVASVARWLTEAGFSVTAPKPRLRPDVAERATYADTGDLHVTYRVEVKHRQIQFTSADDYPYSTIFVDEVYKVQRQPAWTRYYVIVNQPMTALIVIPMTTRPWWQEVERYDDAQQRTCRWFACPLTHGRFLARAASPNRS